MKNLRVPKIKKTSIHPFGMGIKTRNFIEFKNFRYSFNGKEKNRLTTSQQGNHVSWQGMRAYKEARILLCGSTYGDSYYKNKQYPN